MVWTPCHDSLYQTSEIVQPIPGSTQLIATHYKESVAINERIKLKMLQDDFVLTGKDCQPLAYWKSRSQSHKLGSMKRTPPGSMSLYIKRKLILLPFLFLLSFATLSDLGILHYNLTAWTSSWTSFCDTKRCDNIVKLQGWSSVIKDQCKYDDVR